jgi:hypothetical protein
VNSVSARFSEPSPNNINLERHSCLTERTQRSANAFRFGLRGGSVSALYTACGQYRLEGCAELPVAIMQNIALLKETSRCLICRITSHLLHPRFGGMPRYAGNANASALQMDQEENIIRDQTFPGEHLDGKEVDSGKHIACASG